MKKTIFLFIIPFILISGWKGNPRQRSTALSKNKLYEYKQLDGNRINCTLNSDGRFADYSLTNRAGLEWPKGTGKTAVFTAGMILGGYRDSAGLKTDLRMAAIEFDSDYQPGPLLEEFNTTTNSDWAPVRRAIDPRYRLYKICKSDTLNPHQNSDYADWPGDLGAPYTDVNGNGVWDNGIDKPKFYGDQQVWCVINDVNKLKHKYLSFTNPMGVEVQILYYVLTKPDLLNDVMFIRYRIINKSDSDYDSVYIGQWADVDLGYAYDDLPGCDSILSLGYVYNGVDIDGSTYGNISPYFYGSLPPACGFDFLQGPVVEGSIHDSAFFDERWNVGKINLNATSFVSLIGGVHGPLQPNAGSPFYAKEMYSYLNGKVGLVDVWIVDFEGRRVKFWFSGDPLLPPGPNNALPQNFPLGFFAPQDIRICLSSGPFRLDKNKPQEIVNAFIIAQGNNRLSSISTLKQNDKMIQEGFYNGFKNIPEARVEVKKNSTEAEIFITSNLTFDVFQTVSAQLRRKDSSLVTSLRLYDDGMHNDDKPTDGIWANTVKIPIEKDGLTLDLEYVDRSNFINIWKGIAQRITTSQLEFSNVQIFADNITNDGLANKGEWVRFGFTLHNPNHFAIPDLVLVMQNGTARKTIAYNTLLSSEYRTLIYKPSNSNSFFEIKIPDNYEEDELPVLFESYDSNGNVWKDTLMLPIAPFIRKTAITTQTSSDKLDGEFQIIITEPHKILNHLYVIRGVDSINTGGSPGMTLFDSTEKRIVLSNVPFPYADANYSSTPIDGFKILKGTMEYDTRVKNIILTPNESVWFEMPNSNLGSQIHPGSDLGLLYRPPSSIKRGRYHSIEVRFSSKTGYTDLNQNGRYDLMEPYFVDSVNANATQRAFFYKKKVYSSQPGLFKGFRPIPFTVFDVETIPHRQLNVVIDDYYNTQWDLTDLYTISYSYPDYTYIFDTSYDSTGVMYDSTKGGINLLPNLNNRTPIPCQWLLQLATRNHIEPYSYPVTLKITPTYPISSQTEIVFNPTNVVGIDKEIVPSEFKLFQNYPNPFNPTTAISYTLSAVRDVSLKVFDVLGREIVTLVNERQEEGEYTVKWDAAEFSSGVYFYQLRAGEFVQTKKMVIVR